MARLRLQITRVAPADSDGAVRLEPPPASSSADAQLLPPVVAPRRLCLRSPEPNTLIAHVPSSACLMSALSAKRAKEGMASSALAAAPMCTPSGVRPGAPA